MRIVMLGWEFPPFISGGLGTACYGLTKALDGAGHEVLFVLPRAVDRSKASHIKLLSPVGPVGVGGLAGGGGKVGATVSNTGTTSGTVTGGEDASAAASASWQLSDAVADALQSDLPHALHDEAGDHAGWAPGQVRPAGGVFRRMRMLGVPANMLSPYPGGAVGKRVLTPVSGSTVGTFAEDGRFIVAVLPDGTPVYGQPPEDGSPEFLAQARGWWHAEQHAGHSGPHVFGKGGAGAHYQGDLIVESERYAKLVVALTRSEKFDVIHAHDWLTFPAGIALARATGRPLLVHVHSTEFDRSGDNINQRVYDIERRGMMSAVRVIAVSELTRSICIRRYGVPGDKVDVVYNGIENDALQPKVQSLSRGPDKIVLFLGRITMQKGPEYFIHAAKKVLEVEPNTKFVIAGSGDMEARMIELAAELGIGHRVLFAGFLRGRDVERVYQMAHCYVMPSVSEPFGIAPLEAMRNDVPTIISKQSGVGEVLTHVLKVDFWDTHELANKIVAVLRHPPLSQTLRDHGAIEVKKLTWASAAQTTVESYKRAVSAVGPVVGPTSGPTGGPRPGL